VEVIFHIQNHVAVIGEVGFFISFAKKKRSKESCPGNLLNPSLTAAQRARVTALILCATAATAQLEQGSGGLQSYNAVIPEYFYRESVQCYTYKRK